MQRTNLLFVVFTSCFVAMTTIASAQNVAEKHPLEPSDTSSPRATFVSFIASCNEFYHLADSSQLTADYHARFLPAAERIRDCLDLSLLPGELRDTVGVESAVYIKEVLDRIELPQEDEIPSPTVGEQAPVLRWQIPGTRITIARVSSGPREGEYLFAPETVRQAAKIYSAARLLPYRSVGPETSPGFYDRYLALTKRQPLLTADTSSPRGTLTLFLNTLNEFHELVRSEKYIDRTDPKVLSMVGRILRCLDLSETPEYAREEYATEAAACLKEVLDRVALPAAEEIPGPEELVSLEGGEPLALWQIPNTKITIGRVAEGPRRGEYLFTADSITRSVKLYEEVKQLPYRTEGRPVSEGLHQWYLSSPGTPTVAAWLDRLPDFVRSRYFGMAVWQWFGLLVGAVVGFVFMGAVYWIGRIQTEKSRNKSLFWSWVSLLFAIVALLVPLAFNQFTRDILTIRGMALYIVQFGSNIVFLLALIVVILATSKRLADSVVLLRKSSTHELNAALIQIAFRSLGIVGAVIVFLEGGKYLGFPITTLLAGAGISGLAIALAAQSLLKGLFGTVTILFDRPYQSGERISIKGYDGVVENIGMRATKLRLLTGNLVSVPNDQMADSEIENIGRRPHIRRVAIIELPSDTPTVKVKRALEIIRAAVKDHEGMQEDFPPRVFLRDLKESSIGIVMMYWYHPPDYWSYLALSEKVNLQIMEQLEAENIEFAAPALTVHTADQDRLELSSVPTLSEKKT